MSAELGQHHMIRSAHTDKHDNRIADERSVLGGDQRRLLVSELTTRPILTPGFEIICVEPLDDFCTMLQEPGTTLLTRQLEHRIVILLPEHQGTVVDFMNRLSELGGHSDNPTQCPSRTYPPTANHLRRLQQP